MLEAKYNLFYDDWFIGDIQKDEEDNWAFTSDNRFLDSIMLIEVAKQLDQLNS